MTDFAEIQIRPWLAFRIGRLKVNYNQPGYALTNVLLVEWFPATIPERYRVLQDNVRRFGNRVFIRRVLELKAEA